MAIDSWQAVTGDWEADPFPAGRPHNFIGGYEMTNLCHGRRLGFLAVLIFGAPMLLPLAGRDRSKPRKADTPAEPAQMAAIADRIVANEKQIRTKMHDFSPRVETYLQYYKPDAELGDVATNDDYFFAG